MAIKASLQVGVLVYNVLFSKAALAIHKGYKLDPSKEMSRQREEKKVDQPKQQHT